MGRCARCGGPTPGNVQGEICPVCRQKMQAAEYEKQKKFNEQYGSKPSSTPSKPDYHITADNNGNVTYHYSDGSTRTKTRKQVNRGFRGVVIFFLIVIIGGFFGIRYLMFNSTEGELADSFEITAPMSGDGSDFVNEILARDDSFLQWSMKITEYPSDYWKALFNFSEKSAYIKRYVQDGETIWKYDFEDADAGTGLDGIYYLAKVNGALCLVDYNKKVLYPEGSEFYQEHYDALVAFQYDTIMPKLTEGLVGGEYGSKKNDDKVVLKGDKVSASVYDDGFHKTRILDERGEVRVQYELNYYENMIDILPDFSDYETAE